MLYQTPHFLRDDADVVVAELSAELQILPRVVVKIHLQVFLPDVAVADVKVLLCHDALTHGQNRDVLRLEIGIGRALFQFVDQSV